MNTYVDNLTMDEAVEQIELLINRRSNSFVVTPNVDHIVLLEEDAQFKEIYEHADLILTDGQPLIWISKYKKTPIVEKVSGSDLLPELCCMAAQKGYSLFILGAAGGVAKKAAKELTEKYSGLQVVGTYSPDYGFENDPQSIDNIIETVSDLKPDILIVALGSPKGEKFIYRFRDRLNVPISLSLGAAVDFASGNVKRAPKWMSNCGLEWLYRMTKEPKRLAGRYWHDFKAVWPIVRKY